MIYCLHLTHDSFIFLRDFRKEAYYKILRNPSVLYFLDLAYFHVHCSFQTALQVLWGIDSVHKNLIDLFLMWFLWISWRWQPFGSAPSWSTLESFKMSPLSLTYFIHRSVSDNGKTNNRGKICCWPKHLSVLSFKSLAQKESLMYLHTGQMQILHASHVQQCGFSSLSFRFRKLLPLCCLWNNSWRNGIMDMWSWKDPSLASWDMLNECVMVLIIWVAVFPSCTGEVKDHFKYSQLFLMSTCLVVLHWQGTSCVSWWKCHIEGTVWLCLPELPQQEVSLSRFTNI